MHEARRGTKYLKQYQIDYIQENADTLTSKQMSEAIGCRQMTVIWHCNKLKIKATKAVWQPENVVVPICFNPKDN
jgi:ribosomal protein L37AE/L43A